MLTYIKDKLFGEKIYFIHPVIGKLTTRVKKDKIKTDYTWTSKHQDVDDASVQIILDGSHMEPKTSQIDDVEYFIKSNEKLLKDALTHIKSEQTQESEIYQLVLIHPEEPGYFIEYSGNLGNSIFINTNYRTIIKVARG